MTIVYRQNGKGDDALSCNSVANGWERDPGIQVVQVNVSQDSGDLDISQSQEALPVKTDSKDFGEEVKIWPEWCSTLKMDYRQKTNAKPGRLLLKQHNLL